MTDAEAQIQKLCDYLVANALGTARDLAAIPEYQRKRHLTPAHADMLVEAQRQIARVLMPLVQNETQPRKEPT